MPAHPFKAASLCVVLLATLAASGEAEQDLSDKATRLADANAGPQCGGQYECIEYRPLGRAEAQRSRGDPDFVEPAKVGCPDVETATPPHGIPSRPF
jgi:hypothetical protein